MRASTYPTIARFTPAVRDMTCKSTGLTVEQLRHNTLRRTATDLGNFLESHILPLHPDEETYLHDLYRQVRLALGEE